MARQTFTDAERANLRANDPGAFRLPLDASLNLENFAAYGATDTAIAQSLVNIRHLNNTRQFRGTWTQNPSDGTLSVPYTRGQVVIGSDRHIYMLTTDSSVTIPNTIPDPTSEAGATVWVQLSSGVDQPATELSATPDSFNVPLFAGNQDTDFQVNPPASLSFTGTPSVVATPATTVAPTISNMGAVTAAVPNQTSATAGFVYTVTAAVSESGGNNPSLPSTVDVPVTFSDQRVLPTVSGEGEMPRVSRFDSSQGISFNVDLTPDGSTVAAGTAYDVSWVARAGTNRGAGTTDGTYNVPNITRDTDVTFTFPLVSSPSNGQTAIPMVNNNAFSIIRPIQSYIPWYWIFSTTIPTSITGATEAILIGDTQSNAFPTSGLPQINVSGNVGATMNLYFLVDTNVMGNITLGTGVARVQSSRMDAANNFTRNDIAGTAVTYSLHRFRVGLVNSPTTFTIFSA